MPTQQKLVIAAGYTVLILTVAIFVFLAHQSWPFFAEHADLSFVTGDRWLPVSFPPSFQIKGFLVSTLLITGVAVLLGCPLGVISAISLAELLPRQVGLVVRSLFEITAGIPSVVFGFLGLRIVAPYVARVFGLQTGLTGFSAGVVLSVMILPTLVSLAEEALRAVPREYAQASYALGATRWQTIWRVIVPSARGGIAAAILLAIGRAIGETMTVLMVAGGRLTTPGSIFDPMRTLTALIASEVKNAARNSAQYHALFAAGLVLFVITFAVNALAAAVIVGGKGRRSS
ncbi:MAG: phosphate transport system permease protein [Bacillota bacterium]|nr:MAG: phosphate transport system permease protein [Bacillota bacterium]MBS3949273.1 phosphate ABC transporter permease subunit PstC [Peptococcaceae bacterium]